MIIEFLISVWKYVKLPYFYRGRGLKLLGVVITLHDKRTSLGKDTVAQIKKVFKDKVFKTIISKNVRLEESPAYRESIYTFAPDSRGAKDYLSLTEEILKIG